MCSASQGPGSTSSWQNICTFGRLEQLFVPHEEYPAASPPSGLGFDLSTLVDIGRWHGNASTDHWNWRLEEFGGNLVEIERMSQISSSLVSQLGTIHTQNLSKCQPGLWARLHNVASLLGPITWNMLSRPARLMDNLGTRSKKCEKQEKNLDNSLKTVLEKE